ELFAFPAGGKTPFIYYWDGNNGSTNSLTGLSKGTYAISVLDASGCVSMGMGEVVEKAPEVRMPTGYNPAQNGDLFQGVSTCDINFSLWIYNRWGQLIYSGSEGWNGLVNGENSPPGTYSFLMKYSFQLDGIAQSIEKRGSFTLIK